MHVKICSTMCTIKAFPDGSMDKESACDAGDTGNTGSIPTLGRSSGGENGNPLQYSCLKKPMDRAWQATVQRGAKSWIQLLANCKLKQQ